MITWCWTTCSVGWFFSRKTDRGVFVGWNVVEVFHWGFGGGGGGSGLFTIRRSIRCSPFGPVAIVSIVVVLSGWRVFARAGVTVVTRACRSRTRCKERSSAAFACGRIDIYLLQRKSLQNSRFATTSLTFENCRLNGYFQDRLYSVTKKRRWEEEKVIKKNSAGKRGKRVRTSIVSLLFRSKKKEKQLEFVVHDNIDIYCNWIIRLFRQRQQKA